MASGTWLEDRFRRTGLPRSGLAAYLGVDNAAISRLAAGNRRLSPAEAAQVDAYFSLVPPNAPPELLGAVRRLRSPDVRAIASAALTDWLRRRGSPTDAGASGDLLARLARGEVTLRADHIVALARSEGLSLAALVAGNARPEHPPEHGASLAERFAAAARRWAPRGGVPYTLTLGAQSAGSESTGARFAGGAERTGRVPTASDGDLVELRAAETCHVVLDHYMAYLVADDSLSPRFEQGDVLYLDSPQREIRRGDHVVALLHVESGRATALVGRLRLETKDEVVIEPPGGGPRELEKHRIVSLRRVAYCAL